jgi:hypothetical protein
LWDGIRFTVDGGQTKTVYYVFKLGRLELGERLLLLIGRTNGTNVAPVVISSDRRPHPLTLALDR